LSSRPRGRFTRLRGRFAVPAPGNGPFRRL